MELSDNKQFNNMQTNNSFFLDVGVIVRRKTSRLPLQSAERWSWNGVN